MRPRTMPRVVSQLRNTIALRDGRRYFRPQPLYRDDPPVTSPNNEQPWMPGLASPRQLVDYLNDFVVGQPRAKKVLAVAVYNHYNRVRANIGSRPVEEPSQEWVQPVNSVNSTTGVTLYPHPVRRRGGAPPLQSRAPIPLYEKSNLMLIGPTGSGKTLLARTLARVLDVPFSVSDATTFTQAGYVGDDVELCVYRLLQAANWDTHRASTGIIYIDEADKLARRGNGGDGQTRDVGGEGVQQSLLRMMEGSVVTVTAKGGESAIAGAQEKGKRLGPGSAGESTYHVDTSNVLFILSGAFVGLDQIVRRRLNKGSIGFGAQLKQGGDGKDEDFVPFFTPNGKKADVWDMVEPNDLVRFGYIPEFVSRLPVLTTLHQLTESDLLRILTEVKGSLISQYTALFGYSGVEIRFTNPALRKICALTIERGGGARGLRGVMEALLLDSMYEVPASGIRHVLITEDVVNGKCPALYWSRGEGSAFWQAWAYEEEKDAEARKGEMNGDEASTSAAI